MDRRARALILAQLDAMSAVMLATSPTTEMRKTKKKLAAKYPIPEAVTINVNYRRQKPRANKRRARK